MNKSATVLHTNLDRVTAAAEVTAPEFLARIRVDGIVGPTDDMQPALLAPPSLMLAGLQYPAALFSDGAYAGPPILDAPMPLRRARPGERVTLCGIGFGPDPRALSSRLRFFFGDAEAEMIYAGFLGGAVGVYLFEVAVPEMEGGDAIPLRFTLDSVAGRQALYISVENGENSFTPFSALNIQVSPSESDAQIPMQGIGGITVAEADEGLLGAISGTLLDRKGFSDWWYGSAWHDVQIDGQTILFRDLDFLNSVMRNSADDMVRIESAFLCVVLIPGENARQGKVSGSLRLASKVGIVEGSFTGVYTLN